MLGEINRSWRIVSVRCPALPRAALLKSDPVEAFSTSHRARLAPATHARSTATSPLPPSDTARRVPVETPGYPLARRCRLICQLALFFGHNTTAQQAPGQLSWHFFVGRKRKSAAFRLLLAGPGPGTVSAHSRAGGSKAPCVLWPRQSGLQVRRKRKPALFLNLAVEHPGV